jgi:hypothetical protein
VTTIILDVGELIDFRKTRKFRVELNRELKKVSRSGAEMIGKHARDMIRNGPRRTGRFRARQKGKRQRGRSSAPGEYPKERTGKLRRSIRVMRGNGLSSEALSNLDYAAILEETPGKQLSNSRMHISRAAHEKEPAYQKLADRAVRVAIRRAGLN